MAWNVGKSTATELILYRNIRIIWLNDVTHMVIFHKMWITVRGNFFFIYWLDVYNICPDHFKSILQNVLYKQHLRSLYIHVSIMLCLIIYLTNSNLFVINRNIRKTFGQENGNIFRCKTDCFFYLAASLTDPVRNNWILFRLNLLLQLNTKWCNNKLPYGNPIADHVHIVIENTCFCGIASFNYSLNSSSEWKRCNYNVSETSIWDIFRILQSHRRSSPYYGVWQKFTT